MEKNPGVDAGVARKFDKRAHTEDMLKITVFKALLRASRRGAPGSPAESNGE
jgi:hypothetical protein